MIRSTLALATIALSGIVAIFAGLGLLTVSVVLMILLGSGTALEIAQAAGIVVGSALVLGAALAVIQRMSRIVSC